MSYRLFNTAFPHSAQSKTQSQLFISIFKTISDLALLVPHPGNLTANPNSLGVQSGIISRGSLPHLLQIDTETASQ